MRKVCSSVLLFLFVWSISLWADDNATEQNWLDRVHYGITVESERSPTFYFETIQPLFFPEEEDRVLFFQLRCSMRSGTGLYSAGLGYRWLTAGDTLLLGLNSFFDFQDEHDHYRMGVGAEAFWQYLEMRLNTYVGLSPKRVVERTDTTCTYEKAVDGADVEIGGMVPYIPWLKVYFGGYFYDYKHFKDMKGWKFRSQISPIKLISLNFETYDDNKDSQGYKLEVEANFDFDSFALQDLWSGLLESLRFSDEKYPEVDLRKKMLEPVERNYNIQVERWKETSRAKLEIGGRW